MKTNCLSGCLVIMALPFVGFFGLMMIGVAVKLANPSAQETTSSPSPVASVKDVEKPIAVLPGLNAYDVTMSLEEKGFVQSKRIGTLQSEWSASRDIGNASMKTTVLGKGPNHITCICSVATVAGSHDINTVRSYLGYSATVPYEGSKPNDAREWVEKNYQRDGAEATFGAASYQISHSGSAWILNIRAK